MSKNYQSIYTGEEIDRGIGFSFSTLTPLYTFTFSTAMENIIAGIAGTAPTSHFSRIPDVGNEFSGVGFALVGSRSFSFTARVTSVVSGGNTTFELLDVREIVTRNPFLNYLKTPDISVLITQERVGESFSYNEPFNWEDNSVYAVNIYGADFRNDQYIKQDCVGSAILITRPEFPATAYIVTAPGAAFLVTLEAPDIEKQVYILMINTITNRPAFTGDVYIDIVKLT